MVVVLTRILYPESRIQYRESRICTGIVHLIKNAHNKSILSFGIINVKCWMKDGRRETLRWMMENGLRNKLAVGSLQSTRNKGKTGDERKF